MCYQLRQCISTRNVCVVLATDFYFSVQRSSRELGELLNIPTENTTESILSFAATSEAVLDLPVLKTPPGISVQFRIIPLSATLPTDHGWTKLERWTSPRRLELDSTEFRFTGIGTSTLKLTDLQFAPLLEFTQVNNETGASYAYFLVLESLTPPTASIPVQISITLLSA